MPTRYLHHRKNLASMRNQVHRAMKLWLAIPSNDSVDQILVIWVVRGWIESPRVYRRLIGLSV